MQETDLQKVQRLDKYARWMPAYQRRENWDETTARVMGFFAKVLGKHDVSYDAFSDGELFDLQDAMDNMEVLPSMRVVQMAGPALERCNVGAYNCAYLPLKDWRSLSELLYILMQGTGCGFSVEDQYISQLPTIKRQTPNWEGYPEAARLNGITKYYIEDTTEGWCDAFQIGLNVWAAGGDVEFSYENIRPYGAPLKTKGGKASGPEPLKNLLDFTRKLLLKHQGRKLSSLNVHDLACYCGSIVQVGGVRRAAEISLSDLDDQKMRHAKQGQFWNLAPERAMANNSAVYETKPSMSEFMAEWTELMESGTGERGIFNRGSVASLLPERRAKKDWVGRPFEWGLNPCGEIILRPYQFCNLSIVVARPTDTLDDLKRKVKQATQFGILQSLLTDFKYIRLDWKENCEEERLLGVDITGQMDNALFSDPLNRVATYATLHHVALREATRLSGLLGINMPAAITCVKPSGNSSQLLNTSSGIHPRYAPYYIRRLRMGASSPVTKLLTASGVPHFPEVGQPPDNPSVQVFEFIVQSPEGAVCRKDVTALDQLEQWLCCKRNFTEHNPSMTVYVRDDEWLEVGAWVYKNWDHVGGLSFLPYDGGVYQLAPYEEISKQEYDRRLASWPTIDFSRLREFEHSDETTVNGEFACVAGVCEL